MDDEQKIEYKRPVRKKYKELYLPPNVNCIQDLINMAQSGKRYQNINNEMLWKISAQLIEINEMIGMQSLKESIFYHVIYYLQNLFVDDEKDYLHTVIMGPPGTGKCLAKDTPVMMYDGTIKPVQNIQTGELLMGDDCTPRTVLSTCSGYEEMYKVEPTYSNDENDNYIVNKSHILSLKNIFTKQYEDVKLTDYLRDSNKYMGYRTAIRFNEEVPVNVDPYVLGYSLCNYQIWSGHIHIKITHPLIQSYFSCSEHIERIRQNEYKFINPEFKECFDGNYGKLPDNYKYYNHNDLRELLSGMNDAYGQVDKDANLTIFRFTQEQYELYDAVKTICNILGLSYECQIKPLEYFVYPAPTSEINRSRRNLKYYYITILNVFDTLSSMIYTESYKFYPIPIRKVDYDICVYSVGMDNYYGFELDGNQRFVLGNFSVTHNTTIAKIIGEMYKNMGILSQDGVFKIAKREDLVAEYLGQTAIKTKKLLESCIGGVLFVDEVYALGPGKKDQDSFSKEAIDTLNVFLSEHSDDFCCIIAGYEQDIRNCFFSVNQGLERRFQWVHRIEPYSSEELAYMYIKLLHDIKWKRDDTITIQSLTEIIDKNKQLFTSFGGDIENLITKSKMAHAKRIINLQNPNKHVISIEDVRLAIGLMKPNTLQEQQNTESYMHLYL